MLRKLVRVMTVSGLLVCAALAAPAQPAAAELVNRQHVHILESASGVDVCGVMVDIAVDIIGNDQERLAQSGFPLFMSTGRGRITFTNLATDKSVTLSFTNAGLKDLTVTDNGDGTITLRTALTGVPQKVTYSDGTVALIDAGRIVFVTVLDYNGTPTDTSDDEFVSGYVESISGPHPGFEDQDLFCTAVVAGLT